MFSPMNYGDISPRIGAVAVGEMLAYAESQLVLEKFAKKYTLPKNKGQTLKFRRPVPFAVDTNTLIEGQTPPPEQLQYEDLSVSVSQYGGWVQITDVIADTHEDPVLRDITELAGKKAGDQKEAILWGVLRAGTNVIYTGTATSRATVEAPISADELDLATRTMKANHAKPLTGMKGGSTNFGSAAVGWAFVAVGHTNLEQDIQKLDGFVRVEDYGSASAIHPNEIGKRDNIRFILTPHLEPIPGSGSSTVTGVLNTNSKVDVYPLVILADDSYAVTPLKGMDTAELRVQNPGKVLTETDPLGQRGFVSWKFWYAALRLNELWMIRIEQAASAL